MFIVDAVIKMNEQNSSLIHSLSLNSKGKLTWLASYDSLQSFVEEVLCLSGGKWSLPGGDTKLYQNQDLSIRWHTGSKTLAVSEGINGQIENKLNSFASMSKKLAKTSDVNCQGSEDSQSDVSFMFNSADSSSYGYVNDATASQDTNNISFRTPILKASQSQRPCGAFNLSGITDNHCLNLVNQLELNFWNSRRKQVRT